MRSIAPRDNQVSGVAWTGFPGGAMPPPETPRRRHLIQAVAVIALMFGTGYLTWRVLATFAPDAWWLSAWLLLLELHALLGLCLFTVALWDVDSVRPPPPVTHTDLRIAVVIPTYQEPLEVLLPTIAAAVSLRLDHETWVLDDGRREWLRDLCGQLGARYRTREGNEHAKAGNINASLPEISKSADLMAVLDADHVASSDFLTRVLGYFDDERLALVQTPQDFYNTESFEHVHRRRGRKYTEQALFYRALQAGKNRWGAAFWRGTSAVIRIAALREVGGLATETITEDIHTTIRLHRNGWRTVYHNEVLARGLAAADAEQYLAQRVRWGTGAMQVLRVENPMTVHGLTPMQRMGYLTTLGGWFDAWRTLSYVLFPVATLLSGAVPILAPLAVFWVVFGTNFLVQRLALSALSRGHAPQWTATVFEFVRMPANLAATLTLIGNRDRQFHVTAKGRLGDDRSRTAVPPLLVGLLLLSAAALAFYVATLAGLTPLSYPVPWVAHGAVGWLVLNMVLLTLAIRRVRAERFSAERRASVRFDLDLEAALDDTRVQLLDASLTGAAVLLPPGKSPDNKGSSRFFVHIGDRTLELEALVASARERPNGVQVGLEFLPGQVDQQSALALMLFHTGVTPRLVDEDGQLVDAHATLG
jgi:cellulose synthase (UDP-forming)